MTWEEESNLLQEHISLLNVDILGWGGSILDSTSPWGVKAKTPQLSWRHVLEEKGTLSWNDYFWEFIKVEVGLVDLKCFEEIDYVNKT